MKKAVKTSLWIAGGLAVSAAVVLLIFVLTFDANKYKAEIAAAVHKATGRELTIEGDIRLSFFPWLGVELGAARLSNAPGFGDEPFARIDNAALKVKLLPLLRKDVEVDTVTLNGLHLLLRRDAGGRSNWEDLGRRGDEPSAPAPETAAPVLTGFALGGINLRDGHIVWDDLAKPAHYELAKLNLRTGAVNLRDPVQLSMEFDLDSRAPALGGHVQLAATALYDAVAKSLRLDDLKLGTSLNGASLPGGKADIKLAAAALLDFAQQRHRVSALTVDAVLPGKQGRTIDTKLTANVDLDLANDRLAVAPLTLTALGAKAEGRVDGSGFAGTPTFGGEFGIAGIRPREVLTQLGIAVPATADANVLKEARGHVQFTASGRDAALNKLELKLDQTTLTGGASIHDFAKPAVRFQLALDDLDADRYLPSPTPGASPAAAPPAAAPSAAAAAAGAAAPPATLRTLDVDGKLTVDKLKIAKLKLSDIALAVAAKDGVIRLSPITARLYNGRYSGDLRIDARGNKLRLATDDNLSDIAIGPLTRDLLEKDLVAGSGNIKLQLSGTGSRSDELRRTLDGKLAFAFSDGHVNGVNLVEMLRKDYLKYIQGLGIDSGRLNQTVFSKFTANAVIAQGDVRTDDLALTSAQLAVKGRGSVGLVSQQIALRLDVIPGGQFAKQLGDFKDVVVPVDVGGTFAAPTYKVALDQALKDMAKSRLATEKKKLQDQLQQQLDKERQKHAPKLQEQQKKLEQQLQNKLKDLFK